MVSKNKQSITRPLTDKQGRWKTLRLTISSKRNTKGDYDMIKRALADHNIAWDPHHSLSFAKGSGKEAPIWNLIDLPASGESTASDLLQLDTISLPFAVRYQLEVCLSNGYINEHNITQAFLERLAKEPPVRAQGILEKVVETGTRFWNPMGVFKLPPCKRPNRKRNMDRHYAYMRSAQVTPSSIYFSTPMLETSNRVIRRFNPHEDRFLRVRFLDEQGKIYAKDNGTQEEIFRRIARALKHGIRIGDRLYEFLAFGNSQFRERGAYFFASDNHVKAQDIRNWMGNFNHIKIVAKWASRLGQSFSTTRSILGVTARIATTEDVERNGYCFTDGVGRISVFLAQMIAKEFGILGFTEEYPSVFQIRLGGSKGVLAVDPSLKGSEIIIRRSQYKFPASHEGLDVCRYSAFAVSQLNQQLITVLSTLGIPDSVFLHMLKVEQEQLEKAMTNEAVACHLLTKRVDFNQMTLVLATMILDGFMKTREPFMMSIMNVWRAWNLKYLKEKARLTVDKSAFVLGCVDETATLHGWYKDKTVTDQSSREAKLATLPEIFLQIRERIIETDEDGPTAIRYGPYTVKTGICILARNPSLHPGDIRVVRAVDVEALHHLKDVVVLPQTGDRDLANMCSGGDLDGDDYVVIWDEKLIPNESAWFYQAMDFKPPKGQAINRDVTVEDAADFFIKYIKSDRLGVIAHAHLAHADNNDDGVFALPCIKLAHLHSCAVDYPKSGVEARIPKGLLPRRYPHFMNKSKSKTYHSDKVLGQMYDQVQLRDLKPDYIDAFDSRILNAYDFDDYNMQAMLGCAKDIKRDYDNAVRRIMAKHQIKTEFEVWSTFVLSHSRDMGDYKFHEEAGQLACALKDQFRETCEEAAGGKEFVKLGPFIAAMYKATADEVASVLSRRLGTPVHAGDQMPMGRLDPNRMPFMSFPWIFQAELGKIATGKFSTMEQLTRKVEEKKITTTRRPSVAQKGVVPDVETQEGIVHAGETLKLFEKTNSSDGGDQGEVAVKDTEHEAMVARGVQGDNHEHGKSEGRILPSSKWKTWAPRDEVLDLFRDEELDYGSASSNAETMGASVQGSGSEDEEVELNIDDAPLSTERLTKTLVQDTNAAASEPSSGSGDEEVSIEINNVVSATERLAMLLSENDNAER